MLQSGKMKPLIFPNHEKHPPSFRPPRPGSFPESHLSAQTPPTSPAMFPEHFPVPGAGLSLVDMDKAACPTLSFRELETQQTEAPFSLGPCEVGGASPRELFMACGHQNFHPQGHSNKVEAYDPS